METKEQRQTVQIKTRKKKFIGSESFYGWLFISPMVFGFIFIMLGPLLFSFAMSFTDWPLLGEASFIGLGNYQKLLFEDAEFWIVLKNTFVFSFGLVPINIIVALGLAILLNQKLPGMGFFRTTIFIPVITSIVVWSIVWKYMLATDAGFVNQLLGFMGIKGPAWLYDPRFAMPAVIVTSALKNVGLNMVLFLAALQQVPTYLYEAARLDGAGRLRQFRNVTLPMISPTLFLTVIITLIGAMKIFGQIYVMTNGGPGNHTKVLVYYVWENAFKLYDFGYASAVSFILFVIILILTLVQWGMRKRWVFHEQ